MEHRLRFLMYRAESILIVLVVLGMGCTGTKSSSRQTIHLSMIPTTDPGKIVRESQPFINYLEKQTGAKVELTVPTNYAAVAEAVAKELGFYSRLATLLLLVYMLVITSDWIGDHVYRRTAGA